MRSSSPFALSPAIAIHLRLRLQQIKAKAGCLLLLAFYPFLLSAQQPAPTPEEMLADAITQFNAFNEYVAVYTTGGAEVTDETLRTVHERTAKGLALLDKVIAEGSAEQIRVARYFRIHFRYKEATIAGQRSNNEAILQNLEGLSKELEMWAKADEFPLRYRLGEKNYIVAFQDFAPTLQEYYVSRAELASALSRPDEAIDYARRALQLQFSGADPYYRYLAASRLVKTLTARNDYGAATADYAYQAIVLFPSLTESQAAIIREAGYLTPLEAKTVLTTAFDRNPEFARKGEYAGEAAALLEKEHPAEALELYKIAFEEKYTGKQAQALALAKAQNDKAFGLKIVDRLAAGLAETDCMEMSRLAGLYTEFGANEKALALRARLAQCQEAKEKSDRERQRAEAKRARPFNVYLGVYVIPLLTAVDRMDFGGHLDFRGRRTAISFGYVYVQERKDRFRGSKGKFRWDGFEAQFAVKGFAKNSPLFTGTMLAYAEKEFPGMDVLFNPTDGSAAVSRRVNAKEQQYKALWNFGAQGLRKAFGFEMALGLGLSYNHFDPGVAEYDNPDFTTQNDLLDDRKQNSVHFQARFAISVGLNVGPKR